MQDTARYARQSDRELNPSFRRRWRDLPPPPTPPVAADAEDAEPGMATLSRWVDEWRARRAARPSAKEAPRPAAPRT